MLAIRPGTLAPDRKLTAIQTDPIPVTLYEAENERDEAHWIAGKIRSFLGGSDLTSAGQAAVDLEPHTLSYRDIAVLVRTEAQAHWLHDRLQQEGIPCATARPLSLVEDPLVLALLETARRLPDGQSVWQRLQTAAQTLQTDPTENQQPAKSRSRRTPRQQNSARLSPLLGVLLPLAENCGTDWKRFETELALMTETDLMDPRSEQVAILTLHAAKGLEFEIVFIAGCEDGLIPFRLPGHSTPDNPEEERRLFFVGLTRAKRYLFLSWAHVRTLQGKRRRQNPSPFLADLPDELVERHRSSRFDRSWPEAYQPTLF